MSQVFNAPMQYGSACALLGGLDGVSHSIAHLKVQSDGRQSGTETPRRAPVEVGGGGIEMCALVRPPLAVSRHGIKRVLSAVLCMRVL